jgi:outer membrane receptor protein involved in Fe transport
VLQSLNVISFLQDLKIEGDQSMRAFLMSGAALTGLALAVPVTADAQTAKAATAAAPTQLEELLVTAERYTTNVQSTPVAVTALSPQVLEARQVTNVLQVASQIPGVVITPATGTNNSARIVLRGAGQEQSGIQFDAAVGVYIDNVYQPRINGAFCAAHRGRFTGGTPPGAPSRSLPVSRRSTSRMAAT